MFALIGVIYDEHFDTRTFNLSAALQSYLPMMGYILEQSFTNSSSYESPEWVITVRKFAIGEGKLVHDLILNTIMLFSTKCCKQMLLRPLEIVQMKFVCSLCASRD